MPKTRLEDTNLASLHTVIRHTIQPLIEDWDETESALSKTEDGFLFEIRKKQEGKMWRFDALTVNGLYEKLKENLSLDALREQIAGLAIHVGRLADNLGKNGDK